MTCWSWKLRCGVPPATRGSATGKRIDTRPDAGRGPSERRRLVPAGSADTCASLAQPRAACAILGSMKPYARAYMQFLAVPQAAARMLRLFVFATRLTCLTRALAARNPELAIQRAAAAAPDWSSGTRIGDALREFNDKHGRRGMARGAVIVILSDGWERGDPKLVGREMERLARLAHRIVWAQSAGRRGRLLRAVGWHGGRAAALRRARERPQLRRARGGRRSDRGGGMGPWTHPQSRPTRSSRGPAPPRSRAARSGCRAGTDRAAARSRRAG